jgi:hydroxyethylthiazole kinase-like uncharacterized protein yjeF
MQTFTEQDARHIVVPRADKVHKGSNGRVVIVAGNRQFGGAAIMSATAAVYSGAGLTSVATATVNHAPLHAQLPEAMVTSWTAPELPGLLRGSDVIVVGPGLGVDATAFGVLTLVLAAAKPDTTLIIDGSAIDILAAHHVQVEHAKTIWTPHPVELERLVHLAPPDQTDLAVASAAESLPGILVAKGAPTRTFYGDQVYVNTSGNPGMATGGSGDTLTGVVAAFVAQFGYSLDVVASAVWTHSRAADLVAKEQYVAVPSIVARRIPFLMHDLAVH